MKTTALKYWFSLLLIILAGTTLLVSCKTTQPIKSETKETSDKTDFTSVKELTEINKEITDQLIWQLSQVQTAQPECDSITRTYLFQVLNSMNIEKQSGDNGYSLKFNELLQRMELSVKIAETANKQKDSVKIVEEVKEFHYTKEIPVIVPLTWYERLLQNLGFVAILFIVYKIYSFIKGKLSIKN